jgi:hypothetical protein
VTEPSLPEESIFAQALEITDASERAAFLDRTCAKNQALRAEVEALLRAHERSGDLLDLPEKEPVTSDLPEGECPGTVIGPFRLLEQIGEGGMGTVWMAEQTEPIQRRVAVKVVKEGMELADEFPDTAVYRDNLARTNGYLGILLAEAGQDKQAETSFRQPITLLTKLAEDSPTNTGYRADLANNYISLRYLLIRKLLGELEAKEAAVGQE